MRLFGRKAKPAPPLPADLPPGEEVERGVRAMLLYGKTAIKGSLYMTNRRLMFYADRAEARWLIVAYDEVKSAGLYPAPGAAMGMPTGRAQCLFVETTKGEQVWWDFGTEEERAWVTTVQGRAQAAAAAGDDADRD